MKTYLIPFLFLAAPPLAADVPPGTHIVLLGEIHDNPGAHLGPAAVIQDLKPIAVVFEMFSPVDAARANTSLKCTKVWESEFSRDNLLCRI